jgi:hypothetical protein
MELIDIQLITPERHRPGPRPAGEVAKARIRLVIESVFANLKRQMRPIAHTPCKRLQRRYALRSRDRYPRGNWTEPDEPS